MLLRPITIAAAGFAVASAFLLPPDVQLIDIPELMNPFQPSSQDVDVRCPGCPMQANEGSTVRLANVANHLQLHFAVDDNRLQVNGFELYPTINPFGKLYAAQVADAAEDRKIDAELRKHRRPSTTPSSPRLGFNVRIRRKHVDKTTGFQGIALDLQIFEVGTTFVGGIPNLHIKLVKTPDGSLIIGSVKETASRAHIVSYKEKMAKCTTVLCKWRAMAAAHMGQLKSHGCAMMGKMGHKGHSKPGAHHHHAGTHGAWEGHTWHKLVKQLVKYVLYPIILGMVVGVGVCVIGMSVGTIIVACWRIFVRRQTPAAAFRAPFHRRCRRHRRSSRAHKAAPVDAEVAVSEEKSSLIENQEDAPPAYHDQEDKKADA